MTLRSNGASAAAARVREWSEEVARDPASLRFFPLAEIYRAQGRREAALRLCLRGLSRHPEHLEAHHLLGQLYLEGGDAERAADEWEEALRLAPDHAPSRRAAGLLAAERGEWQRARRHLDALASAGPLDRAAAAAHSEARARHAPPASGAAPPKAAAGQTRTAAGAVEDPLLALDGALRGIAAQPGVLGALAIDESGCVLAGILQVEGAERGAESAAALEGTAGDARQAAQHLDLGDWRGILLETPRVAVRLAPVSGGLAAVTADREVPPGWLQRTAERARSAAAAALDGAAPAAGG